MNNKGYIPNTSFKTTIDYLDSFINHFVDFLKKSYKVINFDLPIITNINNSVDIKIEQKRNINFDNISDSNLYQLINNYNNLIKYMIWYYELKQNECALFKYKIIDRDCEIKKNVAMQKNIISINFSVLEVNRNIDFLIKITNQIIEAINYAISKSNNIYHVKQFKFDPKGYDLLSLKKRYPLLSIKNTFERFVASKKSAIIYNVINEFKNSNITKYKDPESYDFENTLGWYVFDDISQTPIEILLVSISPDWNIYQKQKIVYNSPIEDNDYIDLLKSDNYPPILSIKFNYDLLIYYLLQKINIYELPNVNNEYNLNKLYKYFKKG